MAEYNREEAAERAKIRTKELVEKLESGMKELYDSDKYRDYLKTMSKFPQYSSRNIMLIKMQNPQATRVASFNLWKEKFNRRVKKGEKGLYIYAPMGEKTPETKLFEKLDPETGAPMLDKDGKVIMEELTELSSGVRFKLVPVFDCSQTYGDPLPELAEDLTGNVEHYEAFLQSLKEVSPLPVVFEPMSPAQDGYCRFGEKIGIREGMSEPQTIAAVIHEIVHARLHDKNNMSAGDKLKSKAQKECESESIAYVVAGRFGVETGSNSFGYLAAHGSRDMSEIKASLDIIRKEASSLITAIEGKFNEICQQRGINLNAKPPESEKLAEPSYIIETRTENIAGIDFEFNEVVPQTPVRTQVMPEKSEIQQFAADYFQCSVDTYNTRGRYSNQKDIDKAVSEISVMMEKGILSGNTSWVKENLERMAHNSRTPEQPMSLLARWEQMTAQVPTAMPHIFDIHQFAVEYFHYIANSNNEYGLYPQKSDTLKAIDDIRDKMERDIISGNLDWVKNEIEKTANKTNTFETAAPLLKKFESIAMQAKAAITATENDIHDFVMPDPAIGTPAMNLYGYTADDMLPLTAERAAELFNQGLTVYMLYHDNTEAMVFDYAEIEDFKNIANGIFGITKADWETSPLYAEQSAAISAANNEAVTESDFIHAKADCFAVYQIKDGADTRDYRFESINSLEKRGLTAERGNYDLVYTAPLAPSDSLESIFAKFNYDRPDDFTGRSLSVSDVIVINKGGGISSHFVDSAGFRELPAFLGAEKQPEQAVPAAEQKSVEYSVIPPLDIPEPQKRDDKKITAPDNSEKTSEVKRDKRTAKKSEKPSLLAALDFYEQKSREQFGSKKPEPGKNAPIKNINETEANLS